MVAKIQSNRSPHSLLIGMQKVSVTAEDSLAVSYKAKHSLTIYNPAMGLLSVYLADLKP